MSFWALMAGTSQTQFVGPAWLSLTAILMMGLWMLWNGRMSRRLCVVWLVWSVLLFIPGGRFPSWPAGESSYQILVAMIVIAWLLFIKWGLLKASQEDVCAASTTQAVVLSDRECPAQIAMLVALSIMAAVLRYCLRDDISGDYRSFLEPWYQTMQAGGITTLGTQVGDYNLPYQAVIYLMTLLPVRPLYAYKLISCLFDYLLAQGVAQVTQQLSTSCKAGILAYVMVLFFPQVYIDSAHWAQCDAIYVTFLVWAFACYLRDWYRRAFLMLGIALSFKLQAVFVLPFYGLCWLIDRRHAFTRFLWVIPGFYLLCLPGIAMGRSVIDPFLAYLTQTTEYAAIRFNFPSFWGIFYDAGTHSEWNKIAIGITAGVLLIGAAMWLRSKRRGTCDQNPRRSLQLLIWSIWTCVLFLPNMHERYAYALDMFLIAWFVVSRDLRDIPMIGLGQMCSLMCYGMARLELPNTPWLFRLACLAYSVCWLIWSMRLFAIDAARLSATSASTERT